LITSATTNGFVYSRSCSLKVACKRWDFPGAFRAGQYTHELFITATTTDDSSDDSKLSASKLTNKGPVIEAILISIAHPCN
jgi:hypothetical protein